MQTRPVFPWAVTYTYGKVAIYTIDPYFILNFQFFIILLFIASYIVKYIIINYERMPNDYIKCVDGLPGLTQGVQWKLKDEKKNDWRLIST